MKYFYNHNNIKQEKRYIIEPEESQILKRIFHDYIKTDKSLRVITRELKEEGYFPMTSETTLYTELQKWTKDKNMLEIKLSLKLYQKKNLTYVKSHV